ncbi:hypothetical protein HDU76_007566 [Blyttiomyces sp. JEL0837]|nr:hypothetical protein HDU76_007566 [Blyttiomyces sp. JEL0837]
MLVVRYLMLRRGTGISHFTSLDGVSTFQHLVHLKIEVRALSNCDDCLESCRLTKLQVLTLDHAVKITTFIKIMQNCPNLRSFTTVSIENESFCLECEKTRKKLAAIPTAFTQLRHHSIEVFDLDLVELTAFADS